MRSILLPESMPDLYQVSQLNLTAAISLWLAKKSTGSILDFGCGKGKRCMSFAVGTISLRLKRRVIGIDWSQEHRISPKQRKVPHKSELGSMCGASVETMDIDPERVPLEDFQPLTFALLDYHYSLDSLRRLTRPLLEVMPVFAEPNSVLAWAGYREPKDGEPNEVRNYVQSLHLGDSYHCLGSEVAFKVFNATPEFREELRSLAQV